MPVSAINTQSVERDHRSAGEPLKSGTKEFQLLQSINQLYQGLNLNAPMHMNIAWEIN